ncbi:MAG: helix-turn-helix transcriptional regulator [Thermoanaerobacteraceae bacterium]|nr:helix-turn-helix transcriptional regulator [Thermoanaerobacteraceae bacterium]
MNNTDFGNWLKEKRISAGYESQGLLSRACGIDHSTIARWERGDTKPSPDNLKKLAPYLGISYQDLLAAAGYLDDTPPTQPKQYDGLEVFLRSIGKLTPEGKKMVYDYVEYVIDLEERKKRKKKD